ncbi:phospholipase D gamma 1-like [Wolffia australiana]
MENGNYPYPYPYPYGYPPPDPASRPPYPHQNPYNPTPFPQSYPYATPPYPSHGFPSYPPPNQPQYEPYPYPAYGQHPPEGSSSTQSNVYPPLEDLRLSDQTSSAMASPSPSFHHQPAPYAMASPSPSFHYQPSPYAMASPSQSFSYPASPQNPPSPYEQNTQIVQHQPSRLSSSGSFQSPSAPHGGSQQGQIVAYKPGKLSLKVLLLHGSLDVNVFAARNLPNKDMFSKTMTDFVGPNFLRNISGKLEQHNIPSITSDPYVTLSICNAVLGRTYVISNCENPVWNQHFYVPVAHCCSEVLFTVKDSDVVGSQLIGSVTIPAERLCDGLKIEGVYPVLLSNGKPCRRDASLHLSIQYIPAERLSMYHNGVGPGYAGVPGTYFPLRKGGKIKLYQDAHVPEGCLPDIRLGNGLSYEHGRCWEDISSAIKQARRLVYITGWSVYHLVRLVRDGLSGSATTLGDLLKLKSQEGVRVLLLVWDDPTSRNILGMRTNGLMQTHDEETARFFKHSSVKVLLCPRSAGKRHSWAKQQEVGAIYTHHQKTVIVDADAGNNYRRIVAFVGGLDLCDGRYDTPEHPVFRTLKTIHKDDYHNPTFAVTTSEGPREPWHDLHCKIEGSAAYDVLRNFEERWVKSSKRHGIKKLKKFDDSLLMVDRIPDIIGLEGSVSHRDGDPETWHVQIFRSIDSNSVKGFPKDPKEATSKSLVCGKNVLIDMSIHTAYVTAIRAAQHFIYIENQYFIGSSYNWDSYKDLGANNLIPMEIALKIVKKIKANERFSAYIVLPMWPEGDPKSQPMQRILFWQKKTMQMMYETVYNALVEEGLDHKYGPQDYLNFFCLGNREAVDGNNTCNLSSQNAPNALSFQNRRFMIYVHSKGMIVDDEYVIVGSANINQRSMEGARDTEIAMGAFQPYHSWSEKPHGPRGQVYGYRMSLWAEHLGFVEEIFSQPESLECTVRLRTVGEMNWAQFASDQVTEMRGHLLKYPVMVDKTGKVSALPDCKEFPDVGGPIVGSIIGPFLGPAESVAI